MNNFVRKGNVSLTVDTVSYNSLVHKPSANYTVDCETGDVVIEVLDLGDWKYSYLLALYGLVMSSFYRLAEAPPKLKRSFIFAEKTENELLYDKHLFTLGIVRKVSGALDVSWNDFWDKATLAFRQSSSDENVRAENNVSYVVETIAHLEQRYNSVGDFTMKHESGEYKILVSDLGSWQMSFTTALHEFVETALCRPALITDTMIDNFDLSFDEKRDLSLGYSEPGDDPTSPYHKQHVLADEIEKEVAVVLGVKRSEYDKVCHNLMLEYEKRDT